MAAEEEVGGGRSSPSHANEMRGEAAVGKEGAVAVAQALPSARNVVAWQLPAARRPGSRLCDVRGGDDDDAAVAVAVARWVPKWNRPLPGECHHHPQWKPGREQRPAARYRARDCGCGRPPRTCAHASRCCGCGYGDCDGDDRDANRRGDARGFASVMQQRRMAPEKAWQGLLRCSGWQKRWRWQSAIEERKGQRRVMAAPRGRFQLWRAALLAVGAAVEG